MRFRALTLILIVGAFFGSTGCSELAGSGELVSIPNVTFNCGAPNCGGAAANDEFRVIFSEFDCSNSGNVSFYAKRSAAGYMTCSGASCTGAANSWIDDNGASTTLIPAGNYTVCVMAFRQGSLVTGATAQDAHGELAVAVSSSSPTINVTSFSNGVP